MWEQETKVRDATVWMLSEGDLFLELKFQPLTATVGLVVRRSGSIRVIFSRQRTLQTLCPKTEVHFTQELPNLRRIKVDVIL